MTKRRDGWRADLILDDDLRPSVQAIARALGLDVAGYLRAAVTRSIADDLTRLGPVLRVPATGGSAGAGDREPVPRTGGSAGGATGARPGTARALSGSLPEPASGAAAGHPEATDDEERGAVPACGDAGCPCRESDWDDLADLHEAATFRVRERQQAGATIQNPATVRRLKVGDFLAELDEDGDPRAGSELAATLERMRGSKPRRVGRDPTS